jgi:hypothetical protein
MTRAVSDPRWMLPFIALKPESWSHCNDLRTSLPFERLSRDRYRRRPSNLITLWQTSKDSLIFNVLKFEVARLESATTHRPCQVELVKKDGK